MVVLNTDRALGAIGPYFQGFEVNGFVITSGQITVGPASGVIPNVISRLGRAKQQECGGHSGRRWNGFHAGHQNYLLPGGHGRLLCFNEIYTKYFTSKPACSCVAVKELPKGVLCEIEAIAAK